MMALAVLLAGAVPALGAIPTSARIHGVITKIDTVRHTFWIHHAPFALMPMAMTMEVEPVRPADVRRLRVGERIAVTVDTTIVPWPGTDIAPLR